MSIICGTLNPKDRCTVMKSDPYEGLLNKRIKDATLLRKIAHSGPQGQFF